MMGRSGKKYAGTHCVHAEKEELSQCSIGFKQEETEARQRM
jgi:hypothetical protein